MTLRLSVVEAALKAIFMQLIVTCYSLPLIPYLYRILCSPVYIFRNYKHSFLYHSLFTR